MYTIQDYIASGGKVNVAALTEQHIKDKKLSRQEVASRIGISRSMLSQYLSGTYSNPISVEERLIPYLTDQGIGIDAKDTTGNPFYEEEHPLYQSADTRRILAVCGTCQEYAALGVIAGKSGFGKTHTLHHYARLPKVAYIECDDTMGRKDLVDSLEQALGLNQGYGSLYRRTEVITAHINKNPGWLILVDEADKLISKSTQKKMEILRKLVDKSKVGMVIAGEPQLIPMLIAYDNRFANRSDLSYVLNGLSSTEATEYLSHLPMEQQAQEELIQRACNKRNGCFRLLDRTLTNVIRLAKDQGAVKITMDIIEEASDMMML